MKKGGGDVCGSEMGEAGGQRRRGCVGRICERTRNIASIRTNIKDTGKMTLDIL